MSTYKMIHTIQSELRKVNEVIDQKILEGKSYVRESRRHKLLLSQLKHAGNRESYARRFLSLISS